MCLVVPKNHLKKCDINVIKNDCQMKFNLVINITMKLNIGQQFIYDVE